MPIPHRERSRAIGGGTVAYLCVRPRAGELQGALFVVNDRAEPLDFCFNRAEIPSSFLWRAGEAHRHALRLLAASLFTACPGIPDLLLAHRDQVDPSLFTDDFELDIAVGIVTDAEGRADVAWAGRAPSEGSTARALLDALVEHGMALEPFERAAVGLDEALPQP